jgi:putative ABC transport system ATP-binding protein
VQHSAGRPIAATRDLRKAYETGGAAVEALRGVTLSIDPGELIAITGPSGCGKSTLLHLLGGLDVPSGGTVMLAGERLDQLSEAKRAVLRRRHVGYVFQFFNLVANLSVADNVELPMLLTGRSPSAARARRTELLGRLGLNADDARKAPAELSGGEQQRVALARALANEPSVLLADEPTGNLDSEATGEVIALLAECNAAGQTIVLVTHDARVSAAARRRLRMEDGRVVAAQP